MALSKAKKCDLFTLAYEMDLSPTADFKIIQLQKLIINSKDYDEEIVKNMLAVITEDRVQIENRIKEKEEKDMELEKLRIQADAQKNAQSDVAKTTAPLMSLQQFLPRFDAKEDDILLFINLFERQLKFLKVDKDNWVAYLLGVLPSEVAQIIAREPEIKSQDFDYIKNLLLQRFKLNAEKLRMLFIRHRKAPNITWRDYSFEIRSYFESWLEELQIKDFEGLKNLMILNKMKMSLSPEIREHFLDVSGEWVTPEDLIEKVDHHDNMRTPKMEVRKPNSEAKRNLPKKQINYYDNRQSQAQFPSHSRREFEFLSQSRREFGMPRNSRRDCNSDRVQERNTESRKEERPPLYCYGCGAPGVIKAKCTMCNPQRRKDDPMSSSLNKVDLYCLTEQKLPQSIIPIRIGNLQAAVCADTGATCSVAGEKLFKYLQGIGQPFENRTVEMKLADGLMRTTDVLSTVVDIEIREKVIPTEIFVLKHAKGNLSLLGEDFLNKAGIVLDLQQNEWFFTETPQNKQSFIKVTPKVSVNTATHAALQPDNLRDDEGTALSSTQKQELNSLLRKFQTCFQPGGEPTPYTEHRIQTGNHPPVAVPPYRMNPTKKEILKQEIERLLSEGIIEECESPYASPVVLVPKQNGTFRVCIDYRKLNSITTPDNYPLPHMDDLLQAAKPTAFMSTIDLRSGYHQVKVHPDDQDKTAFVCAYGTYRFKRMPCGLRNAPATFQRLMDQFRNGLPSVNLLVYLDDLIVLSPTFEQHLLDLKAVFDRFVKFKLTPNRAKCKFVCPKVKYLGLWITPKGVETDPEKISAIVERPCPRNLKQLQSFIQTCSWYRKFIPNFSEIARPLTSLTKKNAKWNWDEEQQQAFQELKNKLVSSPILKQTDETKPFIIRTDASGYALGACLLQIHGSDEHPVEYASRLLSSAERNYSTTEREALAVIWALQKFRGYVEGSEVTVASDHQPLKWLMSLKSPSGRLARWALEIQSYNLHMQYTPGKSNVIADMLSRPVNTEENAFCEISHIAVADMPARSAKDIREAQLQDEGLQKIMKSLEATDKTEDFANWTERGFLLNQGVLYRYVPEADTEEAQLVIPNVEIGQIMKTHHDDSMAGHYGEEGTFQRIAKRYYWTGMRKFIADYVKKCPECNRYKASNLKPAGLLRTPVQSQRFETISIDLFGPLPRSDSGMQWIFIIEDCATRWVELFALTQATARACATTLIEEVFMRHGIPRRIICDNGPQFVSAVLQQICFTMNIKQNLIPVYCPQANPVERKNRDLKPRLAILVGDEHDNWPSKLPVIRFAMNTAVCETTGHTPAFLTYGKELRTVDDVVHNFTSVVENDNFVAEITPYLKKFAKLNQDIRERIELKQDQRKRYYDKNRRQMYYTPGDKVWVTLHRLSDAKQKKTSKFTPKRDGPYIILTQKSPTSYVVASLDRPLIPLATYHTSALTPFHSMETMPIIPLRKRGRPPKAAQQRYTDQTNTASTSQAMSSARRSRQYFTKPQTCHPRNGPASLPGRLRSQRGRL